MTIRGGRPNVLLFLLSFFFFVAGCGNSPDTVTVNNGSSGNAAAPASNPPPALKLLTPHNVTITVVLPPGVNIPLDTLEVVNSAGSFPVSAAGQATVTFWNAGHHYSTVSDANGRPLLLGFLGPDSTTLSTVTTAQTLAYFRLGGWALTATGQQALSNALTPSSVQGISDVLLALFANSADALTVSSPQLATALDKAATALGSLPLARSLVDPVAEQSGITVHLTDDDQSLIVTNQKHRRAYAYVQQVAYTRPGPQQSPLGITPPRPVADFSIVPTTGIHSLYGTITDILTGNTPFNPVDSEPVALSIQTDTGETSSDAVQTSTYQVRVIGPGSQPSQIPLSGPEIEKLKVIYAEALILDCVVPIVANVLLPDLGETKKLEQFQDLLGNVIPDLIAAAGTAYSSAFPKFEAGDYQGAISDLFQGFLGGNVARDGLTGFGAIIASVLAPDPNISPGKLDKALRRFGNVTVVADAVLSSLDIVVQYLDYASSSKGVAFEVTVGRGRITLSPSNADIDTLSSLVLRVKVQDPPPQVVYAWSLLNAPAGAQLRSTTTTGEPVGGSAFNTTNPIVTFQPGTGLGTGQVMVEAYVVDASSRVLIDSDTANVTVRKAEIKLTPAKKSLKRGQKSTFTTVIPDSLTVNPSLATFEYRTPGKFGAFSGGATSRRIFGAEGLSIDYLCTADSEQTGREQITVELLLPDPESGALKSQGTASAQVIVNEVEPSIYFGSAYGYATYALFPPGPGTPFGWINSANEAGWIVPIPSGQDVVRVDVHIYNWRDPATGVTERNYSFQAGAPTYTLPRIGDSLPPFTGPGQVEEGITLTDNLGLSEGDSVYKIPWTGGSGFGPNLPGTQPPSLGSLLYRVSPSTVEVTVIRQ